MKNQKQVGAGLLGVGLLLTFMGMMLFFEGNLLRLGNICIIAGIFMLIGPTRVSGFFLKESRMQATIITVVGVLLVFWGKPKLGLIIEIFGLLNLFGNMFPMLLAVGRNIPVVGDIIQSFEGKGDKAKRGGARYAPSRDSRGQEAGYDQRGYSEQYDPDF
ncbi:hypothetical protein B484DRAFT_327244 [Ochromonadaceae sp. CCMP2298]|nr:hypothetical protein B484DRAFT_327244 [Ochromonadaceae sp. CCMP2298]